MIPRKKRWRYMQAAVEIAKKLNLEDPTGNWELAWMILDEHGIQDFLYAIADHKNKLVKFGRSRNPVARMKAIKTGNAMDLRLCSYCKHESPFTEREVHEKLSNYRVSGEWFEMCSASDAVISQMQKQSN